MRSSPPAIWIPERELPGGELTAIPVERGEHLDDRIKQQPVLGDIFRWRDAKERIAIEAICRRIEASRDDRRPEEHYQQTCQDEHRLQCLRACDVPEVISRSCQATGWRIRRQGG